MGESWIGGDIGGLKHMGEAYTGAKDDLDGIVKPLSSGVDSLVGDAGWTGEAAESFRRAWTEDALTAGGFAELVEATGKILKKLAEHLSDANRALQDAADVAAKKGVPMTSRGAPTKLATVAGDPRVAALEDYKQVYRQVTHQAQRARLDAANELGRLYDEVTSTGEPMPSGDKIVVADYLRALYSYDDVRRGRAAEWARDHIDEAKREKKAAKKVLKKERAAYQRAGRKLPEGLKAKKDYDAAVEKVAGLEDDIKADESGYSRVPYDRRLNYKLSDAARDVRGLEGLDRLPKFLRDVPVLDIAAATGVGVIEAKEDHEKGWSWPRSVSTDVGAGLVGLGLGAGAVAALPEEAEVLGEGGTYVLGAGIAVDMAYTVDEAFHEHLREDIHDHGVLGGLAVGTGHVVEHGAEDTVNAAKGGVKAAWHAISSPF